MIKVIGFTYLHIIVGTVFFTANCILLAGAIIGFSRMALDPTMDKFVLGVGYLHLYLVIPLSLYLILFTRPHNPFKGIKE